MVIGQVAIHYYGRLAAKQGWCFDSTYDHKDETGESIPFSFVLGSAKFASNVSGEWDGFGADFSKHGEPIELPEYVVPEAFREWEVKVFDWQTQCPTLAHDDNTFSFMYKFIRLLPTVGCEADAATRYSIDERNISDDSVSAFVYQSTGCYVAIWSNNSTNGNNNPCLSWEVEHCLIDPRDKESRLRIVQVVRLQDSKLVLQNIKVFCEHWYGPFRNGEQLGGCAIQDSAFASTQALDPAQVIGVWEGKHAISSFDHAPQVLSCCDRKMTNDSQVQGTATTVAATSTATTSRTNAPPAIAPAEKPEKFTEVPEGTSEQERFVIVEAWKLSDFLCRNYILSGFQDDLYNVYSGTKTAKELWGALERKYKTEDVGTKMFFVARFLKYKMIESKSVVSQVQELQVIIHDLLAEGMILANTFVKQFENVLSIHITFIVGLIVNETFQVAAIIEKLPPILKNFKNYLKHKRKEMSVEDLIVKLRGKKVKRKFFNEWSKYCRR
ncbi:hypothetical protein FXO38_17979 [Capsicum annuum]|nr:hypothetical protein FXO38_17979 [Capsicum annuum]KAF3673916.1 hypothetical protein FXO37_06697 [Capsicum annuum]